MGHDDPRRGAQPTAWGGDGAARRRPGRAVRGRAGGLARGKILGGCRGLCGRPSSG